MDSHEVLVIGAGSAEERPKRFSEAAFPPGAEAIFCQDVAAALEHIARGAPAAVVIVAEAPEALAHARAVRRVWPEGQVILVAGPDASALRQRLARTPMLGAHRLLAAPQPAELRESIAAAIQRRGLRRQLRTTLDRANLRLRAPDRLDAHHYRNLVISDRFLANVLMTARDAIFSVDTDRCVLSWNRGAERLFGRLAADVRGVHVENLPGWCASLTEALAAAADRRTPVTRDASLALAGAEVSVEATVSAVHDDDGELIGYTIVLHDITQRKHMLEAERAARIEAERVNRMKDEFLATLSHELRTPLNAVIGWAQVLQSGRAKPHDVAAGLDAIHRNARIQAQIIEDLLDVSRIISGKLRLDVQPVSLVEVVEGGLSAVAPAAAAKGIRIQRILDPDAGPVMGDPQRLHQVLWNLLTNAVKFTPKGGKVKVQLSRVNSHAEILVDDNGPGIAPEFLAHIFDRFTQADASTTRRHGGLGLGLSIVKQLVEMHGGSVRAYSAGAGHGASFTVELPIAAVHHAAQRAVETERLAESPGSQTATLSEKALAGLRVLVVDDEEDARLVMTRLLEDAGAETLTASSAAEALSALQTFHPQVLISDIGMPERDGYDLIRDIRHQGLSGRELPAIALTAFARSEDRKRALLAGYQLHLPKPVDAHELVASVASLAGMTGTLA